MSSFYKGKLNGGAIINKAMTSSIARYEIDEVLTFGNTKGISKKSFTQGKAVDLGAAKKWSKVK